MAKKPQYLSSIHDRYPAIYVTDHIWSALLSQLVQAAILKSAGVLGTVFGKFNNTLKEIVQDLMFWKSQQVFSSA